MKKRRKMRRKKKMKKKMRRKIKRKKIKKKKGRKVTPIMITKIMTLLLQNDSDIISLPVINSSIQ